MDVDWEWPATACFVLGGWLSASLVDRPRRFIAALALFVLVGAATMDQWIAASQNDRKVVYVALNLLGPSGRPLDWLPAGPFELGAFGLAGIVIAAGLAVRRPTLPRAVILIALGFIGCAVGALTLDVVAYLLGSPRFLDTLQVMFRGFLFPLAASAALGLILTSVMRWPILRPRSSIK